MIYLELEFSGKYESIKEEEVEKYKEISSNLIEASNDFLDEGDYDLFILFTDDEGIKEINREYRNLDKATDVLSFPQFNFKKRDRLLEEAFKDPLTGRLLLGDIVVSIDRARDQASEYGHSVVREIAFLICHGFLHLLGFDHKIRAGEEEMLKKTYGILEKAGYGR